MSAFGTKRTCKPALMNVRFEGNNGHDAVVTLCLLMTHKRTMCMCAEDESRCFLRACRKAMSASYFVPLR